MNLPAIPPYSLALLHQILARFPQPSLFHLVGDSLLQTIRIADAAVLVRVTQNPVGEHPQLFIEHVAGDAEPALLKQRISHLLGADVDLQDFYEFARSHSELWSVVEPLYGLPIDRAGSVYEALIFVIIEQHISWVSAQKAQRRLVEWADNTIEYDGHVYYAMPSPGQIASATIEELKPLKITFKRMQLLIELSQQAVDGRLDLEGLLQQSPEDMYKALLEIKGIGHWTAAVVVSRARGIFPYIPHNDVALQAAVRRYFGTEKSSRAVNDTFAPCGQYAGLAAHFTLMKWVLDQYPII